MKNFYDTIKENNPAHKAKAKSQDEKVYNRMKSYPNKYYTAVNIWNVVFKRSVPITSVRRALSTLAANGLIFKTNEKRKGLYGLNNYCYRFNKD